MRLGHQSPGETGACSTRVLELVDQDKVVAHVGGACLEQVGGLDEHVLEVDRVVGREVFFPLLCDRPVEVEEHACPVTLHASLP